MFLLLLTSSAVAQKTVPATASGVFLIEFVDAATNRPIPMVEAELLNALRLVSDNMGHIAVLEPDLTDRQVRFLIRGHGYQLSQVDLLGERAVTLVVKPGKSETIKLERQEIAERLYRITGSGRYRDSMLAGIRFRSIWQPCPAM
jgi:hypothetical protein